MTHKTTKELTNLGKDLKMAKIQVLVKHGFTTKEIASVMGISESMVKRLLTESEDNK